MDTKMEKHCTDLMNNLRNRTDVRLINSKKDYLKYTSKSSHYMSYKIVPNNLVSVRKSKYSLKLKKPEYIGVYILELSMNVRIPLWLA